MGKMKYIILFFFIAAIDQSDLYSQSEKINIRLQRLENSNLKRKNEHSHLLQELEALKRAESVHLKVKDSFNMNILELYRLDANKQTQIESLYDLSGVSSSSVENQLAAAQYLLALCAIVLTIIGFSVGWYVNKKAKEVADILDRSDQNLKAQEESQKSTRVLLETVNKEYESLYLKLRGEETKDILKRIEKSPEEIRTLFTRLLTLDLTKEDFYSLRYLFDKWHEDIRRAVYQM